MSVAVSIYYLNVAPSNNVTGIAWVIFSVLVLCLSAIIYGFTFKERAALVKESYEKLNHVYLLSKDPTEDKKNVEQQYSQILNITENHSDRDYVNALCLEYLNSSGVADPITGLKPKMDRAPTKFQWIYAIFWFAFRNLFILILYVIPFVAIRAISCLPSSQ